MSIKFGDAKRGDTLYIYDPNDMCGYACTITDVSPDLTDTLITYKHPMWSIPRSLWVRFPDTTVLHHAGDLYSLDKSCLEKSIDKALDAAILKATTRIAELNAEIGKLEKEKHTHTWQAI